MKKENIRYYYIANPSKEVRANVIQTLNTASSLKKEIPTLQIILTKYSDEINRLFSDLSPIYTGNNLTMSIFSFLKKQSRIWNYIEGSLASIMIFFFLLRDKTNKKVFYCREFIISFWLISFICPLLNGKLIYEAHGFETEEEGRARERFFQPILKYMEKRIFMKSSMIVCITNSAIKKIKDKGYFRRAIKLTVIRNGFDSKNFFPREKEEATKILNLDSKTLYFVYTGLTFKFRNVEQIVYGASKLKTKKSIKLLIVGGQENEIEYFNQKIKSLKVEKLVSIIGKKHQRMVALYLSAADFLIIPGVLSWEVSSPLKLFEYMAVKKPIICPDIASHREILSDKDVIFYKKDQLSDALSDALKLNKQELSTYALNSYKISKSYSYKKRAKKIARIMIQEHM